MSPPTTWKCDVCGYVHRGSSPPANCPVCGVAAEMFSPFEIAPATAKKHAAAARWRCTVCDHNHPGTEPPDRCSVCGAAASLFEPHAGGSSPEIQADVEQILILGAGIAGLTAAEQARSVSPQVNITLLGKEAGLPYYRLNLTRLLAGEVTEESLIMQDEAWFAERRIKRVPGEATAIDRVKRTVRLRDGRTLPYDRLVLANGAHSFVPPLPGISRAGVVVLRTLEDARAVLAQAPAGSRCLCLGGGLLGLEAAGALVKRGVQVTVLEGFDWLLPRQLAQPAGRLLERHVLERGIAVRTGVRAEEVLGDERVQGLRLAGGEVLPADLLLLSTGVRPNSYLARQSQLEVKSGVIVDNRMFTSDPAILAAGDVAEHRGVVYGIWPAAYAQGIVAGTNAVGGELEFGGLAPSNRLKVLDVDLYSIGQFQPTDGSFAVIEEERDGHYFRLVCRDGMLVGGNLYGDTALATAMKEAIEKGSQLARSAIFLERFPEVAGLCLPKQT